MLKYVFPIPNGLKGKMLNLNRLYAFPSVPEIDNKNLIILDSGAFALSKSGIAMTSDWMSKLNDHYNKYNGDNIVKVAPDVFLNPKQTMNNFLYWKDLNYCKVSPVIQFRKKYKLDDSIYKQLLFYQKHKADFDYLFISNPGLRAVDFRQKHFNEILYELKEEFNLKNIHILGAGWDILDILDWARLDIITSIDSIAYYNAAKNKICWNTNKNFIKNTFENIAVENANYIKEITNATGIFL